MQFSLYCFALVMLGTAAVEPSDEPHVVVVGGGLAGLTAAYFAAKAGARVTVLEGEKDTGGNSAKASSGMNACETSVQKKLGIKDSCASLIAETLKAGDNRNKRDLVETLAHGSSAAIDWLIEMGVPMTDITLCAGQSVKRTHWLPSPADKPAMPVGVAIMRTLKQQLLAFAEKSSPPRIRIFTETRVASLATELFENKIRVIGVQLQSPWNANLLLDDDHDSSTLRADAVILATGGFSNDRSEHSLLREFAPSTMNFPTTNGPFAQGTGVRMARALGAHLIDMESVQIHPTAFIDPKDPTATTKFLAAEALRGSGALLLNQRGERFGDELVRRDALTAAILKNCEFNETAQAKTAYMVLNDAVVGKYSWPLFNFYWKVKGFFKKVANVDEFCTETGLKNCGDTIRKTFAEYNAVASSQGGEKDAFGKTIFPIEKFDADEPLYFATITPAIHYTMGGVEISPSAEVLSSKTGAPIPALFAAGEVSGGVHGANRLGGNSLLECVVFGRIAGEQAARAGATFRAVMQGGTTRAPVHGEL